VSAKGKLPSIESGAWDQIRGSGRVTAYPELTPELV
jgi:hypothetical protein